MDILLYLTELLQTRKTVGIVGLGTLYKKKSPGKYDAEKHAFVPPSYNLTFTTEVNEQEELANFISQKRNITVDSAKYYISEFAERIQSELADQQESNLESLGKLKLVNDQITFIPEQEGGIGFEFYGLPEINEIQKNDEALEINSSDAEESLLEEIEEENRLEEENPGQETEEDLEENVLINDEQEVYEEIAEVQNQEKTYHNLNDSPPIIEAVEEQEKEEPLDEVGIAQEDEYIEEEPKNGMPFFMKFLIAFLIFVALGAIVYFVNPQFFNNYFNKNSTGKQETGVQTLPNDSLNNKVDTSQVDSVAKNNDLVKLSIDTGAVAIDSSKVTIYEVIVSAENSKAKADATIARLTKKGLKAKVANMPGRLMKISAATFLDKDLADKTKDSLRIILKNPEIYVQAIKPKTHKK
ncbi:hypothetical protein FA048_19175 [Pedobacter polaris]|uniref:CCDC81-like prokaryotic HU domain-containing protein n=1 Tax=Pedobacter polaris TaxID=2571273 RepID=A0A4U1CFV8_9SPHI|nr:SPOR domain-containing protein [Pedobacter polaris]TKC04586.1 hypothetical protein FA048_19175 [Pedobacter polaris]